MEDLPAKLDEIAAHYSACERQQTIYAAAREIESLTAERDQLTERIKYFEQMEPHWAKGYSSDSIAAQVSLGALNQLWQLLGVDDQTQAVKKIKETLKGAN